MILKRNYQGFGNLEQAVFPPNDTRCKICKKIPTTGKKGSF